MKSSEAEARNAALGVSEVGLEGVASTPVGLCSSSPRGAQIGLSVRPKVLSPNGTAESSPGRKPWTGHTLRLGKHVRTEFLDKLVVGDLVLHEELSIPFRRELHRLLGPLHFLVVAQEGLLCHILPGPLIFHK